ncbi:MAG: PA14 domain-containing protein, partial [Akkermansiaceae bacterium]|nr:PA14 domain-containing protein [Akkermansiaceae bacterium]
MKSMRCTPCAAGGLRVLGMFLAAFLPAPAVEVFTDAACTQPGLTGSYVNSTLNAVKADDWRATPGITVSGTRVDPTLAFTTGDWGPRAGVGVTGGSDGDWDEFSVQWDGYLRVNDDGQRVATASDDGSRMWIDANLDGQFGSDELLDNGWGRGQGVTIGSRSGPLAAGVYPIRIQYYEIWGGNEFHLVDSPWVPMPFMETPDNPRQTVRVLVLNFEPRVPSEGNRRMWEVFDWPDPRTLASQFAADLEFMTGGAIRVEIVDWRDVDGFPVFADGFRYTPDGYVANRRANSGWHTGPADFDDLLQRHNLLAAVNDDRVDEIWCFGDHYFELFGEAWMAGPNPFFINGPSFPEAGFDRAVAGYGFNYERSVGEMLHNLSHRTENHGQRAFGGWNLGNPQTAFDHFSANFLESSGHTAGVGTCHVPANADGHYDYANGRVVDSTAFDWVNFPDLTGETTEVSRDTWGMGPAPDFHRDYMNFYFGMMPRNPGTDGDGRQANWFKYIWDFNSYEEGSGLPRAETAFASAPRVRTAGATSCRFTVRYYDETGVAPETLDDDDASVTGPDGFEAAAMLVDIGPPETTTAGEARTVTYQFTPPGGAWNAADNGTYRIHLHAEEVRDGDEHAFPEGEIGSFQVVIDDPATLDLTGLLAAGGVTANHTPFDIGAIGNLFDGSVNTLVRTPAINPLTVTLEFTEPQVLHGTRAWFTATWGDPAYRWQMETADTLADLDQRTGSWRQAVPLTGTPSDSFSAATLDPPVTARCVRLTAQRLTGDNYVHACEWQLVGPPVPDTAPPAATATCASVSTPGATAHFITVDLTDETRVATASLDTGNLIVGGPGGLAIEPVFYGVDNHLSGTPRQATYWFIPPGGSWNSDDNGTYTITLRPGQVRDSVGNTHAEEVDIGSFSVSVPAPVRRPACDLTENNAASWAAGADGGTAAVFDDTARKTTGQASVRFETDGGFDSWLRFPPEEAADWDLTAATTLTFGVYAENLNPGFQENSPWLKA